MSIREIDQLKSWIGSPPRSPLQTHGLNESDCEVLNLENGTYLASTIDTLSEEIAAGIYQDPYKIGWIAAMASLSDLAAVGASPLGVLLSAEWQNHHDVEFKSKVASGFSDALRKCKTYWLGGDTGRSQAMSLGSVALGLCHGRPLSRLGISALDWICVTGQLGQGPCLAIRYLRGEDSSAFPEDQFMPVARLDAGIALRDLASSAMDTSDGLLQTLETLRSLNGCSLELTWNDGLISEPARSYCKDRKIPLWTLWEVEHGDYQLVLTVPDKNLKKAMTLVPDLRVIGRVSSLGPTSQVLLRTSDLRTLPIDASLAHTLLEKLGNLPRVLEELIRIQLERGLP